jgi:hypothetical protein
MKAGMGKFLGTLRDQIDPDHVRRAKAKELLRLSQMRQLDCGLMVRDAYQTYLRGNHGEALKMFVAAAKLQEEVDRLSEQAEDTYPRLGPNADAGQF